MTDRTESLLDHAPVALAWALAAKLLVAAVVLA